MAQSLVETAPPKTSLDQDSHSESFLRPAECLELGEAELSSRPFSQYDLMPWRFDDETEMADFTMELLRRFSAIREGGRRLPQAIYVLWNRQSGEYLVRDLACKPTVVGQEAAQRKRGFTEYSARLECDGTAGGTAERFEIDPRWRRAAERPADA